jgi:hypothetical protein
MITVNDYKNFESDLETKLETVLLKGKLCLD